MERLPSDFAGYPRGAKCTSPLMMRSSFSLCGFDDFSNWRGLLTTILNETFRHAC
jgi:hypothetical protein